MTITISITDTAVYFEQYVTVAEETTRLFHLENET